MRGFGYYINLIKSKTKMNTSKKEALERLNAIEVEQKKLRAILEAPEVKEKPTTLKEACKNQGVDYNEFLGECAKLPRDESGYKKLKLIIKDVRGNWEPTLNNIWYYPYHKRTKTGCVYAVWVYDDDHYFSVGSSLVLENSADAEYVGKTFEAEYNEYYNVK
jgi:hypothetical protein